MVETIEIRFRRLTFGVLEKACAFAGIDMDDVLLDPACAFREMAMSPSAESLFCRVVLENDLRLEEMEEAQARHIAAMVIQRFFDECLMTELNLSGSSLKALFERTGAPGGGGATTTIRRVAATYPPADYNVLVHEMRLADMMTYLGTVAVNATYAEIE